MLFEGVEPTGGMQVLISEVFGPLKDHPVKLVERVDGDAMPGVIVIRTNDQTPIVEIADKRLIAYQPWHFDHSYNDELNRAGVLRAEAIAAEDGLTAFADGIQIYRDMDPELRAAIENAEIRYTLDLRFSKQRFGLPEGFRIVRQHDRGYLEMAESMSHAVHPAVWTRATGEKVLHMSPYGARGIVGDDTSENDALLARAWDAAEAAIVPYLHRWKPTDMVIWDNWRMLHKACGCDPKYNRVMHRTTIKGDYGFGRWEDEAKAAARAEAMA